MPRRLTRPSLAPAVLALTGLAALAVPAAPSAAAPAGPLATITSAPASPRSFAAARVTDFDRVGSTSTSSLRAVQRRLSSFDYRAARRDFAASSVAPLWHDEVEPVGIRGSNDTLASAERTGKFGTGKADKRRLRILGSTSDTTIPAVTLPTPSEDNGTRASATDTGIDGAGAVAVAATIGDGPHGSAGDGLGDFDEYRLVAGAGTQIEVDTRTSDIATALVVYDASGHRVAGGFSGLLRWNVTSAGTFYVLVGQFEYNPMGLPSDPDHPRSPYGANADVEGAYHLDLSVRTVDRDFYRIDLAKGDVVGATVKGSADTLTIYRPDGARMVSSQLTDASQFYPISSPLPGGGNTVLAFVAERTGRYAIAVDGPAGAYDASVEDYRPQSETKKSKRIQTIFLDFNGARINSSIVHGFPGGVHDLSPFSTFVPRWGFKPSQADHLADLITTRVQTSVRDELKRRHLAGVSVRVVSSLHSKDLTGKANVAHVIVGGSTTESNLPPTAWAQFIDPGNFDHEDNAIVLLDTLSDPASPDNTGSLNTYLTARSNKTAFVTRAIGDLTSHEIGHLLGNFHTDPVDGTASLMDSGGGGYRVVFGVGKDGVGGTADDVKKSFSTDTYAPDEGFGGLENTTAVTSWALVKHR